MFFIKNIFFNFIIFLRNIIQALRDFIFKIYKNRFIEKIKYMKLDYFTIENLSINKNSFFYNIMKDLTPEEKEE